MPVWTLNGERNWYRATPKSMTLLPCGKMDLRVFGKTDPIVTFVVIVKIVVFAVETVHIHGITIQNSRFFVYIGCCNKNRKENEKCRIMIVMAIALCIENLAFTDRRSKKSILANTAAVPLWNLHWDMQECVFAPIVAGNIKNGNLERSFG